MTEKMVKEMAGGMIPLVALGKVREVPPTHMPRELIVFADARAAQHAGFKGHRHPQMPWVEAWWLGRGHDVLRGSEWGRVTVTDWARRSLYERNRYLDVGELDGILHELRSHRLRLPPMVWMEL